MDTTETLRSIFDRIKLLDAPEQGIDLNHPTHRFTVWSAGFSDRLQYCGSRQSLSAAWKHAEAHTGLKNLYIVRGPLDSFGFMKFERH